MKTRLLAADTLVLVIDIQGRLMPAIAPEDQERLERNSRLLIEAAQLFGIPVVASEQYPTGLGPTRPAILEVLPAPPIDKVEFSAYANARVRAAIEATGRQSVVLCGVEAHVCVLQTALDLLDAGYRVHVARDAVGSRRTDNKLVALDLLRASGAVITSVETAAFQWCEGADNPRFKALAKLVKDP